MFPYMVHVPVGISSGSFIPFQHRQLPTSLIQVNAARRIPLGASAFPHQSGCRCPGDHIRANSLFQGIGSLLTHIMESRPSIYVPLSDQPCTVSQHLCRYPAFEERADKLDAAAVCCLAMLRHYLELGALATVMVSGTEDVICYSSCSSYHDPSCRVRQTQPETQEPDVRRYYQR